MRTFKRVLPMLLILLWDAVSVALSLYLALRLVYLTGIPNFYRTYMPVFMVGLMAIVVFFNLLFGCYNRVWASMSFIDILTQATAVFLDLCVIFLVDFGARTVSGQALFPVNSYIIWTMTMLILSIIGRGFARLFGTVKTSMQKNRLPAIPVVVYGAGESGTYLQNTGGNGSTDRLRICAFIDDNPTLHGRRVGGVKIVGGFDKLGETVEKTGARQVIVAIPAADRTLLQNVMKVCKKRHCAVRRFGTLGDASPSDMKVSDIHLEDLLHRDSVQLNMSMVQSFIKDKVVLVSGGAGSIGSELCRQALRFGCRSVVVLDFNENGLFHIGNELEEGFHGRFHLRLGSIRDPGRLEEVFREFQPEIVFHAAAHKHVPMMEQNPREAIKNNVFGTVNIARTAARFGVKKFITISTDKAVNPTNIMGASKRITELIMQMADPRSQTEFAAVRFGNVLGSNGSVVPFFREQIEKGGPVTVTHPEMRRYFMTIPEACQLVLEAGAMAAGGEIFVLDMGEPVLISDLARDMIRLSGLEPDVDVPIVYTGLRPGEKLFEEISLADEDVDHTANRKIMVMKPVEFDRQAVAGAVEQMEEAMRRRDDAALFRLVERVVPTFLHEEAAAEGEEA